MSRGFIRTATVGAMLVAPMFGGVAPLADSTDEAAQVAADRQHDHDEVQRDIAAECASEAR